MVNDLGIDPNEWVDALPPRPEEQMAENFNIEDRVDPPAELMEIPTSVKNPKPPVRKEEKKTPHHIAYEIATGKYNPFAVGGTEQLGGGSENRLSENESRN